MSIVKATSTYFVAVRRGNSDEEWFDIGTMNYALRESMNLSKKADSEAVGWSAEHPVIRFAEVKLVEVVRDVKDNG